jgi:hypothetical protein
MVELIPVLIAFALGSVVWRNSKGTRRIALSVASVLTAAVIASFISGEVFRSSLYLLIDLLEATFGFAAASTLISVLAHRKTAGRLVKSA